MPVLVFFSVILIFFLSDFNSGIMDDAKNRPNIVLILTDDLGYGDLSVQGAKDLRTPNIDAIAKKGITFSHFYANSPVCSPSRAAIMTGKYPDMVGVPGVIRQDKEQSWGYMDEKIITLPQMLQRVGYQTALIGKWHLGFEKPNTPNSKGFRHFKGFLGDMMDDYWTHLRGNKNWMRENEKEIHPTGHATDIFTDWAIDYLKGKQKSPKPFFLYLAYNAPHFPIQPPQDWLEKVGHREQNISEERAKNVALIEHLDFNIGKVLNTLNEQGLDENTLVIFTSDNGGERNYGQSNSPLRGYKQEMYEGGIRIPFFAMWKNKIKQGSRTKNIGIHMDLFPTLCEIAGETIHHKTDGISLLPTLLGEEQMTDDRFLFWVRREGGRHGGQAYYATRYKEHKILQNSPYEALQIYNIQEDELEQTPLVSEKNENFRKLQMALQEHIRKSGAVPWQKKE